MEALNAEGCLEADQPGSTRPLNEYPLFNAPSQLFPALPDGWPRYRPGQFPRSEDLHRRTIKLTVPYDDEDLTDDYIRAFEKVITHHNDLKEEPPR